MQAKNCCIVMQQFYSAYRAFWGPHNVGGAQARPECRFK
jgi:hypothetical protein